MAMKDIKALSVDELHLKLLTLRKEQAQGRMQKATGQMAQVHIQGQIRKDIARIKTMLSWK